MASFGEQASSLAATAAEIASLKGAEIEARILREARASLVQTGHDNWNGGIEIYSLILEVPVRAYAAVEDEREQIEKSILSRIQQLTRGYGGISIAEIIISPVLVEHARPLAVTGDGEQVEHSGEKLEDAPSYWAPGHFRLFISHASEKQTSAHRLKDALANYQIAAFVAHDDIEPTKEWQAEIETALRTMDALAAIISPAFLSSRWCDQEVGIAVGRGKLVVPLRVGSDPHGFLGKYQGLQTKGSDASGIAKQVFEILLCHDLTSQRMLESLAERMSTSKNWASSKQTALLMKGAKTLTTAQAGRLLKSIDDNSEVGDAIGVPEQIRALITRLVPNAP
jgi:hypothetical protein